MHLYHKSPSYSQSSTISRWFTNDQYGKQRARGGTTVSCASLAPHIPRPTPFALFPNPQSKDHRGEKARPVEAPTPPDTFRFHKRRAILRALLRHRRQFVRWRLSAVEISPFALFDLVKFCIVDGVANLGMVRFADHGAPLEVGDERKLLSGNRDGSSRWRTGRKAIDLGLTVAAKSPTGYSKSLSFSSASNIVRLAFICPWPFLTMKRWEKYQGIEILSLYGFAARREEKTNDTHQ